MSLLPIRTGIWPVERAKSQQGVTDRSGEAIGCACKERSADADAAQWAPAALIEAKLPECVEGHVAAVVF
jgi:hypothetical protein